jgi:hypothetical protein
MNRRDAIASTIAMFALPDAFAQGTGGGNIARLRGDVLINDKRLYPDTVIQTGDKIRTAPGSAVIFTIGDSALWLRPNSDVMVERGRSISIVAGLRILTGAVVAAFGKPRAGEAPTYRTISTPTLTAGIRGTGIYIEDGRDNTYFCNCYGTVELIPNNMPSKREVVSAEYHASRTVYAEPRAENRMVEMAKPKNHTDEELELLAGLIGQRTAWQITGKKGPKDGMGATY